MNESSVLTRDQCEKDHALWKEEIEAWRKDHARALHTLEEVSAFILRHEADLEEHLSEVREHEAARDDKPSKVETHRERHLKVQHRQNIFRGRHRGLIKEVMQLQVALKKAGHGAVFD